MFLDKTRFSKDELTREKLRTNDLLVLFKTRTDRTHALIFGGKNFACPAVDRHRKKCLQQISTRFRFPGLPSTTFSLSLRSRNQYEHPDKRQ